MRRFWKALEGTEAEGVRLSFPKSSLLGDLGLFFFPHPHELNTSGADKFFPGSLTATSHTE